jgi:2'-5' RNA ligase
VLLALDIAILPPPEVRERAVHLSASLPARESRGLRLDAGHLPHITLTQQFVALEDLDAVLDSTHDALRDQQPLALRVAGAGQNGRTVWMAIERSAALARLHTRLMDALRRFERTGGNRGAFVDDDGRLRDVAWVRGYRLHSSLGSFRPHMTLGHARQPPPIEPFTFEAAIVAACHLGRFCTCGRVLRRWRLRRAR